MMAEHTEGPWIVKGRDAGLLCVTDRDSRYVVDRFKLGYRPPGEHLANARLIAAAPDLLAACRRYTELVAGPDQHSWKPYAEAHEMMLAAIARATGESPP